MTRLDVAHLDEELVELELLYLILKEFVVFQRLELDLPQRHLEAPVDYLLEIVERTLARRRELGLQVLAHAIALLRRRPLRG